MSCRTKILTPVQGMGLTNSHFCLVFPKDSASGNPDSTLRNSSQEISVLDFSYPATCSHPDGGGRRSTEGI